MIVPKKFTAEEKDAVKRKSRTLEEEIVAADALAEIACRDASLLTLSFVEQVTDYAVSPDFRISVHPLQFSVLTPSVTYKSLKVSSKGLSTKQTAGLVQLLSSYKEQTAALLEPAHERQNKAHFDLIDNTIVDKVDELSPRHEASLYTVDDAHRIIALCEVNFDTGRHRGPMPAPFGYPLRAESYANMKKEAERSGRNVFVVQNYSSRIPAPQAFFYAFASMQELYLKEHPERRKAVQDNIRKEMEEMFAAVQEMVCSICGKQKRQSREEVDDAVLRAEEKARNEAEMRRMYEERCKSCDKIGTCDRYEEMRRVGERREAN